MVLYFFDNSLCCVSPYRDISVSNLLAVFLYGYFRQEVNMKRIVIVVALMGMLAGGTLTAGSGTKQDRRPGDKELMNRRGPVVVHASRYEARILRSIEVNRRRIAGLRNENRRLADKLSFVSHRKGHSIIRKMNRNKSRILRLERENRILIRQLRHR